MPSKKKSKFDSLIEHPDAIVGDSEVLVNINVLIDYTEDLEIAKIIQERRHTSKKEYIPFNEVLKKAGIDPDELLEHNEL